MRSILVTAVLFLVACGGGGGVDLDDFDPRCVATCTANPPEVDGAGDVCNDASQQTCLDLCEARIAGQASLCQTCLLEQSYYGTGGGDGGSQQCNETGCTLTGRGGTCTYPHNDETARQNCVRQVFPRREVACEVGFRPVSECATTCQM